MVTPTDQMLSNLNDIEAFMQDVNKRVATLEGGGGLTGEEWDKVLAGIADVQEQQRKIQRAQILRTLEDTPLRVMTGPYEGAGILELGLARRFAASQSREPSNIRWLESARHATQETIKIITPDMIEAQFDRYGRVFKQKFSGPEGNDLMLPYYQRIVREWRNAAMARALDSTTAGSGDELVATLEAAELWMDVNLMTMVAGLIPVVPMPSNPFDIPRQLGTTNWYPGTENTAGTQTDPSTGKSTLTAYELVGENQYSYSLDEDAVLATLQGEIRTELVRGAAEVMDDVILNADTTLTNNINADGATIAATDTDGVAQWLIGYDGLRHLPLVDNTAMGRDDTGTMDLASYTAPRGLMKKYGTRPSELAYVVDPQGYADTIANVTEIQTLDKYGPNATILTGELGRIGGVPVIVSEVMRETDDDGLVTDPVGAAGNDNSGVLIFNRTQWRQGFRRDLLIEVERDTQKRATVLTASFRHALTERSGTRSTATHTALSYNIT